MKEVQAWYNGRGARVVNERQAWYNRWAVVVVTKHLGPGPHPSGSPQSAHAGGNGEEHKKRAIANRFGLGPDEVGFADVTPVNFNQILNRRLPKKYHSYVTRYSPKEYRVIKDWVDKL